MHRVDSKRLNEIPILDVAGKLGIHVGRDRKAICFIHDEKTPSLAFFTNKNTWYCFGCGKGTSVIDLVMQCKKLQFVEACNWLDDVFLKSGSHSLAWYPVKPKKQSGTESLHKPSIPVENTALHEVYSWILENTSLSSAARGYLEKTRRLDPSTIAHFQLRDVQYPSDLFRRARLKFGENTLLEAGLLKDRDSQLKDIWWDHVLLIPFFDEMGKVIYIQGRNLRAAEPKYVNLSEVSPPMFNLKVLATLKPNDPLYICEGAMDTMMVHEIFPNVIGMPSATTIKEQYLLKLLNFDLHLIPDHDQAGESMFEKLYLELRKFGVTLKRIPYDGSYKDISELLITNKS
jgi:DNA primase